MLLKNLYFFIQARPKEYEKRDKKYGRIEIRKIIVGGGADWLDPHGNSNIILKCDSNM